VQVARSHKESSATLERDSMQELVKEVKALKKQVQAEAKHSKQLDSRLTQDEEALKHVAAEEAQLKEEHEKQQKGQKVQGADSHIAHITQRTRTKHQRNKESSKDYKGKHEEEEDESDDDEEAYEEEDDANSAHFSTFRSL